MIPKVILLSRPTSAWLKLEAKKRGVAANELARRILDAERNKSLKKFIKRKLSA